MSWRANIRCLHDSRNDLRHNREYGYRAELDLMTLVTDPRGRDFPLTRLAQQLRCPEMRL